MSENDIRFIGDLQRLELKPGDRFVLTCERHLTLEQHGAIQRAWRDFIGGDVEQFKLLVLEQGMKLGAIAAPNGTD